MNRFINRLLVFLVAVILAYPIVIILADQLIPHSWKRNLRYKSKSIIQYKLEDLKDEQDLDVLFIGSSHCYRGFDTRIFKEEGFNAFNLGSSSQTPKETNLLLNKYLPQLKPKLIIYEVFPTCFELDGLEASLNMISAEPMEAEFIPMLWRSSSPKLYNTFIVSAFHALMKEQVIDLSVPFTSKDIYHEGGFVERVDAAYDVDVETPRAYSFRQEQLDAFEHNVKLIQEQGINLLFVYAPITNVFETSRTNPDLLDQYLEAFEVPFWDYHQELDLVDSLHFYDEDHLNTEGVKIFNKVLLEQLYLEGFLKNQ